MGAFTNGNGEFPLLLANVALHPEHVALVRMAELVKRASQPNAGLHRGQDTPP